MTLSYKNKVNVFSMLAAIICAIFIAFIPNASAYTQTQEDFDDAKSLMTFAQGVADAQNMTIMEEILDPDNHPGIVATIISLVTSQTSTFNNSVKVIDGILCGVAFIMVCALALSKCVQNIEKGHDTMESYLKILIEIVVAGMILMKTSDIMAFLIEFGLSIVGTITSGFTQGSNSVTVSAYDIIKQVDPRLYVGSDKVDWGFVSLNMTAAAFSLMLPWCIAQVTKGALTFCVVQIMIELGIKRILAPLALWDIYGEGLRSPGARYLKDFLGGVLKLGVATVVISIINSLSQNFYTSTDFGSLLENLIIVAIVTFAGVTTILKSGEYINKALGV